MSIELAFDSVLLIGGQQNGNKNLIDADISKMIFMVEFLWHRSHGIVEALSSSNFNF